MGKAVIQSEVDFLGVGAREPIFRVRCRSKGLLHTKYRLKATNEALLSTKACETIICLGPVSACVRCMRVLDRKSVV